MKVYVKRWGINGEGIGYNKKTPVFLEGTMPGELVEAEITQDNDRYQIGKITQVLEESPRRRHPVCDKWQDCGGCSLMHVDYKGQTRMKEHVLKEALKKYAGYTGPIEPIIKNPSPLAYRNALKMPVGKKDGQIITGMYRKGTNSFVPLERCLVHSKNLEKARREITELFNKYELPVWDDTTKDELLSLVMKEYDGKVHVVLVTSPTLVIPQELIEEILQLENVASLWQSFKTKQQENDVDIFGPEIHHLGGAETMDLQLEDLKLQLLPRSFFQLNTTQAANLYRKVMEQIPADNDLLVEAYSGIGAMALLAADKAKEVIGIENIPDAVENATVNAAVNGKDNVTFVCSDAAAELAKIANERKIDTLLVDPPRSGMNQEMLSAIEKARPETLVYVSCNPSTLAKDIATLAPFYSIASVQPLDMFSQTPHVETICLLKARKEPEKKEPKKSPRPAGARPRKAPFKDPVRKKFAKHPASARKK